MADTHLLLSCQGMSNELFRQYADGQYVSGRVMDQALNCLGEVYQNVMEMNVDFDGQIGENADGLNDEPEISVNREEHKNNTYINKFSGYRDW